MTQRNPDENLLSKASEDGTETLQEWFQDTWNHVSPFRVLFFHVDCEWYLFLLTINVRIGGIGLHWSNLDRSIVSVNRFAQTTVKGVELTSSTQLDPGRPSFAHPNNIPTSSSGVNRGPCSRIHTPPFQYDTQPGRTSSFPLLYASRTARMLDVGPPFISLSSAHIFSTSIRFNTRMGRCCGSVGSIISPSDVAWRPFRRRCRLVRPRCVASSSASHSLKCRSTAAMLRVRSLWMI